MQMFLQEVLINTCKQIFLECSFGFCTSVKALNTCNTMEIIHTNKGSVLWGLEEPLLSCRSETNTDRLATDIFTALTVRSKEEEE